MSNHGVKDGCYLCLLAGKDPRREDATAVDIASGKFNFGARDPQLCEKHALRVEELKQ